MFVGVGAKEEKRNKKNKKRRVAAQRRASMAGWNDVLARSAKIVRTFGRWKKSAVRATQKEKMETFRESVFSRRVFFLSICTITSSARDNVCSRSNRNYECIVRCRTLWTKRRPCSNNCCKRSASSCRSACRSARPGRERRDNFRFLTWRCRSKVAWYRPSRRFPCKVSARSNNYWGRPRRVYRPPNEE